MQTSPQHQHRTARRFKNPPPLFRWASEHGHLDKPGLALVFGAGLLVEADALLDMGWKVDALETASSIAQRSELYATFASQKGARLITSMDKTKRRYRLITVTHVLEFIAEAEERLKVLRSLGSRLAAEGILLLSLRGWSDVQAAKTQTPFGDGILTGLGTFTRGFTIHEAQELVSSAGLKVADSPHGERASTPEQVRLLCQKI